MEVWETVEGVGAVLLLNGRGKRRLHSIFKREIHLAKDRGRNLLRRRHGMPYNGFSSLSSCVCVDARCPPYALFGVRRMGRPPDRSFDGSFSNRGFDGPDNIGFVLRGVRYQREGLFLKGYLFMPMWICVYKFDECFRRDLGSPFKMDIFGI